MQDFQVFMNNEKLDSDTLNKTVTKAGLRITTQLSVGDLAPLTTYRFQIVAVNALTVCYFDEVAKSEVLNLVTTEISPPGEPQIVPVRETGAGITLRLLDPRDKGGSEITRYLLYYKVNGSSDDAWALGYNGSAYQAVVAPLLLTTAYAFKLSVNNGFFESANSSEFVRQTTNVSAPGACAEATLLNATGGMLNVSWEFPLDNGGSEITQFIVTLSLDADGSRRDSRIVNTATHFAFYKLLPSTVYRIVVRAENRIDKGPESNPVTFNTTAGSAPAGSIGVDVLKTSGGAAVISFTEPQDLGGASPLDIIYRVFVNGENRLNLTAADLEKVRASAASRTSRRLTEFGHHRRLAASTYTGVTIGGLDPGELYNIEVMPISAFGVSKDSGSTPAETEVPTAPSEPLALTLEQATGGSLTMKWDPPLDTGGVPLGEYTLFMATTSSVGPFSAVCIEARTLCTVSQLLPATRHWFYAVARNEIGESQPTSTVDALTVGVTPPSSPLNARVTMVDHNSVECAWDPPEDLGGSVIANYTVVVESLDGAFSRTATETSTRTAVPALASSTQYTVVLVRG